MYFFCNYSVETLRLRRSECEEECAIKLSDAKKTRTSACDSQTEASSLELMPQKVKFDSTQDASDLVL